MEWESRRPFVRAKLVVVGANVLRLVEFQRCFVEPEWCEKPPAGYVI
jgi:hypothetical protein